MSVSDADDDTILQTVVALANKGGINYDMYDAVSLQDTTIDVNNNMR